MASNIVLKNFFERGKDEKVKEMRVHFMGESYVWFEFVLENGRKIQTLPLRGEV